jgi:transglutaminase-like putative cysteine protease
MKSLLLLPVLVTFSAASPPDLVPTVPRADSIYLSAVKPTDFPDDAVVWLLDEGVYRTEPDGRTNQTIRQVIQILKPEGANMYQEQRLTWNPERQKLTVNWMKVVKPDGSVVAEHPEQMQDSDVPAAMGTPMYTASKVRRISLSGLEPGTILDFSVTTETFKPAMDGDFLQSWRVTPAIHVVRSNLVVDLPDGFKPRIVEKNLDFKRTERVVKGRRIYTWATSKVPRLRGEAYAPDSLSPVMTVMISPPVTWAAIGQRYLPIAREAYAITPSVEEKMAKVLTGSRSLDDSVAALHKWIAQDIRYVSIALGQGGYVPRSAEAVVRTGYGDCKDKAMLFVAALKKIGVTAYPVLLNINGGERRESPSIAQFNHMIAAVKRGNAYQFADLTAGNQPLGRLPRSEQGNLAVIVKEEAEEITLPETSPLETVIETTIVGTLSEDGYFTGTQEELRKGDMESTMRFAFQTQLDSTRRQMFGRAMAGVYFDRPETDSLEVFDGRDFSAPARMKVKVTRARMISRAGDVTLLTNPVRPLESYARAADILMREKDRKLPYSTGRIVAPYTTRIDVRVKLPPGWTAVLPRDQLLDVPLARYEMKYSQTGSELHIQRSFTGLGNVVPASRRQEMIDWLRTIASDDSRQIVIKAPPHLLAAK